MSALSGNGLPRATRKECDPGCARSLARGLFTPLAGSAWHAILRAETMFCESGMQGVDANGSASTNDYSGYR